MPITSSAKLILFWWPSRNWICPAHRNCEGYQAPGRARRLICATTVRLLGAETEFNLGALHRQGFWSWPPVSLPQVWSHDVTSRGHRSTGHRDASDDKAGVLWPRLRLYRYVNLSTACTTAPGPEPDNFGILLPGARLASAKPMQACSAGRKARYRGPQPAR